MAFKEIIKKGRKHFIIPHLIFWVISIVLFPVVLIYTRGDFNISDINLKLAINILTTIGFLAVSVYINVLWLIPAFFNKKKYGMFLVTEIANIMLFIVLNYFVSYFFEGGKHPNILSEFLAEFILVLLFLIVSTLVKFMRESILLQDVELRMKEVEKQKVEAELSALKAQINPHFLFNTLNSLYSLSLDKSDKAPELILKLSELMRYVIYQSKEELVPIGKQLEFLQSYVYLERVRANDCLSIDFTVQGDHLNLKVAPLLYIAFIENAFKHGAKLKECKPFINILFNLEASDRVGFFIQNNKDTTHPDTSRGGIGLANVKKRLELLYPGKFILHIDETKSIYNVDLTILLS